MANKDSFLERRGATLILKITLLVMATIVILLAVFALPSIWKASIGSPLIVIGLYTTTIPFFFALWQTFKLLGYIETNQTFTDLSVQALKNIKYSALVIGVLYLVGLPLLLPIAEADDAPGLLVFGFLFACIPIVVAVFAEVLRKLLQHAIDIKSENELTV